MRRIALWQATMTTTFLLGLVGIASSTSVAAASSPLFVPAQKQVNGLSNWGGYIATGSAGEFKSISAQWRVPLVTCRADKDLYAPWVGIDGDGSSTVEQTGVQTSCSTGSPVHSAWYEMFPKPAVYFPNPLSTGDSISASVTYAAGKFTITISDTTKGWTQTLQRTVSSRQKISAEAVIEAPGGYYPAITKVKFTQVLINGADLNTLNPITSKTGNSQQAYGPGSIKDGTNFSIKPT